MQLKTCGKDGCNPIEQIRGEMRPGDYYDVIASNRVEKWGSVPEPEKYGYPIWPSKEIVVGHNEDGSAITQRWSEPLPEDLKDIHCVDLNDDNAADFRVCCTVCGRATGWGPQDFPGMPQAGADWIRKKWDKQCP